MHYQLLDVFNLCALYDAADHILQFHFCRCWGTQTIITHHHHPKAAFRQTRQCADRGNNRFWSRVPDKLLPCVPAPPVLSLCGAAGSWAAGWTPASCPGSICRGGREEWRRLFLYSTMKSRLCLPVSMTTTLLQYSAVGQPLHLKAFLSGVSVALCIFFSRFFPSSSSSPLLSADALKADLRLHFLIRHHPHLTQGWNFHDDISEPVAYTVLDFFKWALSVLFAGNLPINLPQIISFMNMHMHT